MDYEKEYKESLERARQIHDGNPSSGTAMVVCEQIFPELRESEDERIINAIIGILKNSNAIDINVSQERMFAWLEKQKINTEGDFGRGYDCGYQAGYAVAMNEMKPKVATVTLDSEKQKEQSKEELVYRLNGLMQDYVKEGKDDEEKEHRLKCYQLFWDALEDTNFFEQKEQPTDAKSERVIKAARRVLNNWLYGDISADVAGDLTELEYAIREYDGEEKQKEHQNNSDAPNESSWPGIISSSDKDKNLDEIAQDYVDGVKEYNPEPTWDLMQTAVCYGYHYREQEEQKPASTEDMPYITDEHFYEREPADSFKYKLAEYMTKCCTKKEGPDGYTYGISAETILKMAEEELLKRGVVQKPVVWSEEDQLNLSWVIAILNGEPCDLDIQLESLISWLKSLRPHWEPSEEQMEAFRSYIKDFQEKAEAAVGGWNNFDVMIRLYEQLKKLI